MAKYETHIRIMATSASANEAMPSLECFPAIPDGFKGSAGELFSDKFTLLLLEDFQLDAQP